METMNAPVTMVNGGRGEEEGGSSSGAGTQVKRGTKRDASDSRLSDFERFEKRLRMLSIRNDAKRAATTASIAPITSPPTAATTVPPSSNLHGLTHPNPPREESMHVDDTSDRVYIHDLDAELAEDEPDEEEQLIFLPDIEKKFSKIPQQVLNGRSESDNESKELVLYGVPASLTVDEEHDTVRKVIMEARQRAREKANALARQNIDHHDTSHLDHGVSTETGGEHANYPEAQAFDPDAMDIG